MKCKTENEINKWWVKDQQNSSLAGRPHLDMIIGPKQLNGGGNWIPVI